MEDNVQYLQMFLDESMENIQRLGHLCLELERGAAADETYAELFRSAHTLKGMSATMGFQGMAQLTHALEDAMGYLRDSGETLQPATLDVLFTAVEALENTLEHIRVDGVEQEAERELITSLRGIAEHGQGNTPPPSRVPDEMAPQTGTSVLNGLDDDVRGVILHMAASGVQIVQLTVELEDGCMMKGPRAVMVMNAIESFGDCLYCDPPATDLEAGDFDGRFVTLIALSADANALVAAVQNVSEVKAVYCADWTLSDTADDTQAAKLEPKAVGQKSDGGRAHLDQTIRVPVERLDRLMNLLSELVIDKNRLASLSVGVGQPDVKSLSEHLSRISTDLQSTVMSLRMVPVDTLFQRFPRMIRDLSKSLKKEIHFEMIGGETELDRTVIDEMGEALVHLIRNAADHGLESTADRLKAGKPAEGTLRLNAYTSGQHVVIEVVDDGQGIDVERVRAKAVERGLLSDADAARLDDGQVYQLLFASGFSTAEQVSDISGRGVGMDAVKGKVEHLGGQVYIRSEKGRGTTVTVQLPLTLSILQALLVRIAREDYAIPLSVITEVMIADESDLETVQGQAFLRYQDHVIPILDSGMWLNGVPLLKELPWQLVVCRDGDSFVAIAIDDLLRQEEIVHKSLGEYLKHVDWFSGATILGDGQIALIIDVHAWANHRTAEAPVRTH